jgi:preprotein translocase subunit SecD
MIESCSQYADKEYGCRYTFSVTLSVAASQKRAQITKNLPSITSANGEEYLTKNITFFLDGEKINELLISSTLRGSEATTTSISGYSTGYIMEEARKNTVYEMEKLQTILYTGKLPVQLEIVDFSEVSPTLGQEFINNSVLVAILSLFVVSSLIYLRYKKFQIAFPVILTMTSEIIITLGFAALVKWNMDLPSIAGIIVSTGTGVDDQIVITDEVMRGEAVEDKKREYGMNITKRIKNAFFMVVGSFSVTLVAMLPLYFAGAGQLRGCAFTTIVGISIGVFLTRPAFADLIKELLSDK